MNKRGYSVFCLTALLVFGANLARAQDLTPVETDAVGTNPISMATGDFNQDGFTDIVVANWNSANVSVLLNLGLGNAKFSPAVPYTVGTNPHAVAAGDFDGDGFPDLAVANNSDGTVSILLNNGDGTFGVNTDIPGGNKPYAIAVTDFNGDGFMDIVVVNQFAGVSVLLGNGDGSFQPPVPTAVGMNPVSVAVGNFYTTGFNRDLAVADMTGTVYLLRYKTAGPPGNFQAPSPIPFAFPRPFAIITADLGNPRPALIVTDYGSNVYVLLGTGPGTFSAPTAYPVGYVPTSVAVGDFNGDTKKDLLVANSYSGTVTIYHGTTPAGTFDLSSRQDISTGMLSAYVVTGDFKKNPPVSVSDAAVALYFSNAVSILEGIRPAPMPVLVGHTISAPCNAPATTCSVTYNATAGNTLVVSCPGWSQVGSVNAASVTDTLGAVFTKDGQRTTTVAGTTSFTSLFHSFSVATGGSRTITCNMSGGYWGVVIVAEFSVVTGVDGLFTSNRGNSTSANSGNLATTHAVDVLVGTVSSDIISGSCTFTPTGGWATVDAFLNSNSTVCAGMVYKIVPVTAANYKTTVTVDSAPWAAAIRAYK